MRPLEYAFDRGDFALFSLVGDLELELFVGDDSVLGFDEVAFQILSTLTRKRYHTPLILNLPRRLNIIILPSTFLTAKRRNNNLYPNHHIKHPLPLKNGIFVNNIVVFP